MENSQDQGSWGPELDMPAPDGAVGFNIKAGAMELYYISTASLNQEFHLEE